MLIMMMMLINSFKNIFHFSFTGRRVDLSEGTVGGSGNHVTREQRLSLMILLPTCMSLEEDHFFMHDQFVLGWDLHFLFIAKQ